MQQREQIYLGNKQVLFLFLFFPLKIHFDYRNTNLTNCNDLKENMWNLKKKKKQKERFF